MSYLVKRGVDWPSSLDVRERIRAGERIEPDDRGEEERYEIGEVCDPPADVLPTLLGMDGVLEEIEDKPPKPSRRARRSDSEEALT